MIIFSMLTAYKSHRYELSNVDNIPSGNTAAEDQHAKQLYQSQLNSQTTHRRSMTGSIWDLTKYNFWINKSKDDRK